MSNEKHSIGSTVRVNTIVPYICENKMVLQQCTNYASLPYFIIDIDECANPSLNDCPNGCINVPGSYQYNCTMPGFQTGDDGSPCEGKTQLFISL